MRPGWHWLAWGAILTGTLLRVEVARRDISLWQDEAMLALNILGRGWAEQFQPLWFEQAAPPLYLLGVRLVALPAGGSEFWLRLPSLVAGLGLLVVVWEGGRRIVGPEAAAWAAWIIALSAPLIHYANELKPYQTDALVAVALVGLAGHVLAGARGLRGLAALGAVAVLLSFTAVFVLATIVGVLGLDGLLRREWRRVRAAAALALLWSLIFLSAYVLIYQGTAQSEFMQAFWSEHFLHPGAGFVSRATNALAAVAGPLPIPGLLRRGGILLVGGAIAAVLLVRTLAWPMVALLVGPVAFAGLASMLGLYPFGERTVLFLAPISALVVATAVVTLLKAVGALRIGARTALAGLLLLPVALRHQAGQRPPSGPPRNEREVIAFLAATPASDAILLTPRTVALWVYYTEDWRRPDRERVSWHARHFRPIGDSTVPRWTEVRRSGVSDGTQAHTRDEIASVGNGIGVRADGRQHSVPFQTWGPRVSDELAALGVARAWVYTARDADIEALADAWRLAGGVVAFRALFPTRQVLELSLPGDP